MKNGDVREFVDKLWGGEELIYTYNGKKYFSQGYTLENGLYRFGNTVGRYSVNIIFATYFSPLCFFCRLPLAAVSSEIQIFS